MLELRGITKVYATGGSKHKALNKVSLNFRESEFVAILGPSGSGKTTLLNIIGGLDHYTSGDLKINEISTKNFHDKDWDAYRNHRIGFVFQSYNLIPHQTVLSNVVLALTLSGISKREAVRRAKKALADVGLAEHINKKPSQLSGGQMQRVAIARALVNDPDILLADEPTGALDSETSIQIMNLLKNIARKKLVIMVTHNPELAEQYATRTITLKDGVITSDSDEYDGKVNTNLTTDKVKNKTRKTKMSFVTALSLSLKNLLTKKGRTILVAFAGSIGIVGIALILAVSTGFQAYIDSIENDTLTSYPLAIQRETADLTAVLLSSALDGGGESDGKVHENQVLASALGNVTNNDLKSFQEYLDAHYAEVAEDLRVVEREYSVEPLVYTIDATDELAQLNPNNLFSSVLGGSQLISSYTSVYQQYERANMEQDLRVLAGRLPEKYNELVVVLSQEGKIGDLLTYSLGLHDTDELNEMVTKLLSGETVTINNEPLTLTYEDIMNIKLKLLFASDLYKYNATYNIYEDMSGDESYMRELYARAEELKIVGVATPRDNLMSISGVAYLPDLVTYVIEKSAQSEIVQQQIANPSVDVFSNTKFGEKGNDFNFKFEDLVKVDQAKLSTAIKVNIDQNAISQKTGEYLAEISNDITTDISPARTAYVDKMSVLCSELDEYLQEQIAAGNITMMELATDAEKRSAVVGEFLNTASFDELSSEYLIPAENLRQTYAALIDGYILASFGGMSFDDYVETAAVSGGMTALAEASTKFVMQKTILTKVGELSTYLTNTFATGFGIDPEALLGAFSLNLSQDELTRIVTAMFTETESTYASNLVSLGYQELDEPTRLSFYFTSFDGKTDFMEFIDNYNNLMREFGQEEKVIEYTDTTGLLMNSVKIIVDAVSYVLIAFVSISLIVSSIMIGIITYISVYERTKEIGILRAIGASKRNISSIFNAETFIVGLLSGLFGIAISYLLIPIINLVLHAFIGDVELYAQLAPASALVLIVISVILTLIGGLIPARAAAKKDPVEALRSE